MKFRIIFFSAFCTGILWFGMFPDGHGAQDTSGSGSSLPVALQNESSSGTEAAQPQTSDRGTGAPVASPIPTTAQGAIQAIGIPFAVVFIVASIIAMWSAIERLVMLRRRRVIPKAFVDRFLVHLRSGRMEPRQALQLCQQNQSPIADVFAHGVRKWGRPSVEVEQAVLDGGERQISQLKKRLRILNGVAAVTPLVGLLGTVWGMIKAFNDIATANAMGRTQELASGIATALLTTAAGLLIAIPALTAYMFLAGRIDSLVLEMDRLGQQLVDLISQESLRRPSGGKPVSNRRPTATETEVESPA